MTIPPSMTSRVLYDACREIADGCVDPDLVAKEAMREVDEARNRSMGWGPEEEAQRRYEDAVERDSRWDEKETERRAMGWMSAS